MKCSCCITSCASNYSAIASILSFCITTYGFAPTFDSILLTLLEILSFATYLMQLKNVACSTCCMQLQNSCMWDFLVA